MQTESRFSTVFALVVGLLFVGLGLWLRDREAKDQARLTETRGAVVESVKGRKRTSDGKDIDVFAPVIEFEANGEKHRLTGVYEPSKQSNGNPVAVRYDPSAPGTTARVVGSLEGLVPWSLFALGGVSVFSGLTGFLRRLRQKDA